MLVFKRHTSLNKEGFTLIEIMVSVLIISTVVMAMLQLFSNNTHFFQHMDGKSSLTLESTLLIGAKDFGFEKKETTLYDLIDGFEVDNEVRKALKEKKVSLNYVEVTRLDGDDLEANAEALAEDDENVDGASSGTSLEIGKSIISTGKQKSAFLRIKLQ